MDIQEALAEALWRHDKDPQGATALALIAIAWQLETIGEALRGKA